MRRHLGRPGRGLGWRVRRYPPRVPHDPDAAESPKAELASLRAQLQAALQERNEAWTDAHRARALEQELAHARGIIEEMKGSPSWRLTAPVRGVKGQTRSAKRSAGKVRRALRGS